MTGKAKILVLVELNNEPSVMVDRASWLANLTNCDLEILLCEPSRGTLGSGILLSSEASELDRKIRQFQQDFLEELAASARERGVDVSTDVVEERPVADAVMARAVDMKPKYVVKGTQYHSDADRWTIVDTDWQLMRICPYPLWLVKAKTFREEPVVIAAVDPMHEHDKPAALDDVIIEMSKFLTGPTGGELHLFHSYQRLIAIGSQVGKTINPVILEIDKLDERLKKEHRKALDRLARKNDIDEEHTHQLPGRTHELLPMFARSKKADLVVMGALARWGIKRMVIGSTAERVIDYLPCDVLIVRLT